MSKRLVPEKSNEIIVRMYRQGLGDCFLIALPAGGGKAKYLLIDCGVHMRQTNGPDRLAQVMENLADSTGSRLDVVVATHEHADHLSGFVQKGSPFLKDDLEIGQLWVAWTEKRGDGQADKLRRKRGTAQRVIDKAVDEASKRAGADGPAMANRLKDLTDFDRPAEGSVDIDEVVKKLESLRPTAPLLTAIDELPSIDEEPAPGIAKKAKKKKKNPSSNELALGLLALKAGDNNTKYWEPGETCDVPGVPNLRAYVLGPPRSDLLEKEKPSKIRGASEDDPGGMYKEVYLTASQANRALELSPRFMLDASAVGGDLPSNWRYPFPEPFGRPCEFSAPIGTGKDKCWNAAPPPADTGKFVEENYLNPKASWRRIDADWLTAVDALALNLANDTNNSSLALAFEWGAPGDSRVLLFAADAQVGNWLSWRDQTYGPKKLTADNLLSRALLYKVGHHGSHNSTLRRDPRDLSTTDPNGAPFGLELMNDIIAMIPVDHDAVRKEMPDPWRMPHEPLYRRLREKARRRIMRSDQELAPLDNRREDPDLVPTNTTWTAVPGVSKARWRKSTDGFKKGTPGPLYYDLSITMR